MSCPDPYRPYNPFEPAPDRDVETRLHESLPSDADVRGLANALAASGGGASSEDLVLDLVLNQIVEQACLATGATGAAIALTRNGEMVCRATHGKTAPDLGVRLDNAGFSAECLRVGMLQRCDDTETDPRVDGVACRELGVRSILVVPLWYWGEFMGIFEIFSPRPNAFGERDEQTLQALAYRIVRHTKQANGQLTGFASSGEDTVPLQIPAQDSSAMPTMPLEDMHYLDDTEPVRERPRTPIFELKPQEPKPQPEKAPASADPLTTIFAACAAVIACLILALMVYRLSSTPTAAQKTPPPAPVVEQVQELDLSPVAQAAAPVPQSDNSAPRQASTAKQPRNSVSAADVVVPASSKKHVSVPAPAPAKGGGLAIYDEKGKLIYGSPIHDDDTESKPRKSQATAKPQAGGAVPALTVKSAAARTKTTAAENPAASNASNPIDGRYVRLKPDLAESLLDERVEPEYPDAARRAHIQGSVILETLIGSNGKVQEVTPVSGPPQLAEAAANAVRQWKYKPFTVDGQKVPIRTQVTVTFMLAQ
jgi:TonB family protein